MKLTPQILGAVAIVGIAGAVSGATIGDSPVLTRGHSDTMPEAPIVRAGDNARLAAQNPPDHYPLKTSEGTIPVEELALRGRMHDRGGDLWWEGRDAEARQLNAGYDFYERASPERIEHERRLLAFHETGSPVPQTQPEPVTPPSQPVTRAEAPMALAEPAAVPAPPKAPESREVDAKSINVSSTLADRD